MKQSNPLHLEQRGAVMDTTTMNSFIERIGRSELFDEIKSIRQRSNEPVRKRLPIAPYPNFLKAVRVAMVEFGYDAEWVETVFRSALEKRYLAN